MHSAVLALADGHGMDVAGFTNWIEILSRSLYHKPIYRFLMLAMSPERMSRTIADRWGTFHQGTSLSALAHGTGEVVLALRRPRPLLGDLVQPTVDVAFRVAIEEAGGRRVAHTLVQDDEDQYVTHWTWVKA